MWHCWLAGQWFDARALRATDSQGATATLGEEAESVGTGACIWAGLLYPAIAHGGPGEIHASQF